MNIGQLDRRIRIESPSSSDNSFGEPITTWVVLETLWARVQPLTGTERFTAQQFNAELDTKFTLRYRDGIDETMRIVYGGSVYDIDSVIELGRREGLEILAKSRVLEGV